MYKVGSILQTCDDITIDVIDYVDTIYIYIYIILRFSDKVLLYDSCLELLYSLSSSNY